MAPNDEKAESKVRLEEPVTQPNNGPNDASNPPTNDKGHALHDAETEKKAPSPNAPRASSPRGDSDPANSRADKSVDELVGARQKFRDINERQKMTAEDLPIMTGAQMDEQVGTSFANSTKNGERISPSAVAGLVVGTNNKDLVDPTADNRSRFDEGLRPPLHRYDENSSDKPEDRDFFAGSRPETS